MCWACWSSSGQIFWHVRQISRRYRRLGPALEGMHWQGAIANILGDFLLKKIDIPVYLACMVEITSPDWKCAKGNLPCQLRLTSWSLPRSSSPSLCRSLACNISLALPAVGITAAVVSADIVNLSTSEMLALTTDLRGVCYGNTDIYYGSPRTPEILAELRRF